MMNNARSKISLPGKAMHKSKGMAMLEVLIAMLVVAIGVLPLVFLQVRADRGVMSAYTKVEHNAAALSIMDLIAADANKTGWEMSMKSGDCAGTSGGSSGCTWRNQTVDNLLMDVLPNSGSGLVCITKDGPRADGSLEMSVTLWWFSAGRGKAERDTNNKLGAFTSNDCNNLDSFASNWNIDTVQVTRIF